MQYLCCDEHRREAVRAQKTLGGIDFNGIDYLEVVDTHTLKLHFVHPLVTEPAPDKANVSIKESARPVFDKDNVSISGGERIRAISVSKAVIGEPSTVLTITLNKSGDLSTYTLHLTSDPHVLRLDPLLSTLDFTFASAQSIDCEMEAPCQPDLPETPDIDYLARDFSSIRQLILDRLSVLMPQWQERSAADLGVMLVELLAYVGDHLSYQQDVIATESYLSTARRRISVRRHARLLEYFISDGCNARVWAQVRVKQDIVRQASDKVAPLPKGTRLLTKIVNEDHVLLPDSLLTPLPSMGVQGQSPEVFETMYDVNGLFQEQNTMYFHTWGARECCLPTGTTHATLQGRLTPLRPGDILIFKEVFGAHTGIPEDAEPAHCHAVRLTSVTITQDPLGAWSSDKHGAGRIEQEKRIIRKDIVEEDVTFERDGEIVHQKDSVERDQVTDEKIVIEDGQVVQDQITQTDTTSEDDEENTQKLPSLRREMHKDRDQQRGKAARKKPGGKRGKKKEEDEVEEFEEEQHTEADTQEGEAGQSTQTKDTVDITSTRTVEEKTLIAKGVATEVTSVDIETHTVEEVDITKTYEPDYAVDITEIEWHIDDALPFPLCISATTDYAHGHAYLPNVSVALGNIVLADHGLTLPVPEMLAPVPASTLSLAATNSKRCEDQQIVPVPARFSPALKYAPLTCISPYDEQNPPPSAWATMQLSAHNAGPAIWLNAAQTWLPQRDLLQSTPVDRHFVVESENDGTAYLRFGDDRHGLRPQAGTVFAATYRVGNGVRGNVGREALYHIISSDNRIDSITNPLPASGGVEPESSEDVRQKISRAFLTQERGVTPQDYKDIAESHPQVKRANAILRWTGSWPTVFLVVERVLGLPVDGAFLSDIRSYMERFRMAGRDIVVVAPIYVSLEIALTVTVQPDYFRAGVRSALLEIFSNRQWPDGQHGLFYPDNYSFGQSVYINTLFVAAMSVPGVASVDITTFQRQGIAGSGLTDRVLPMAWLEIARLENNPRYPEHGLVVLRVKDGK